MIYAILVRDTAVGAKSIVSMVDGTMDEARVEARRQASQIDPRQFDRKAYIRPATKVEVDVYTLLGNSIN